MGRVKGTRVNWGLSFQIPFQIDLLLGLAVSARNRCRLQALSVVSAFDTEF